MEEERDKLSERVGRRFQPFVAFLRNAADLHARTQLDDLVKQTLLTALEIVGADDGSILLYEPKKATLVPKFLTGPAATALTEPEIRELHDMAGQVFQLGNGRITLDLEDAHWSQRQTSNHRSHNTIRNMITVPLKTPQGPVIGVMQVLNKQQDAFDTRDLAVLEGFSVLAAVAIQTHRLLAASLAELYVLIAGFHSEIWHSLHPVVGIIQTLEVLLRDSFANLDTLVAEPGTPPELAARLRETGAVLRDLYPEVATMVSEQIDATQQCVREVAEVVGEITRRSRADLLSSVKEREGPVEV